MRPYKNAYAITLLFLVCVAGSAVFSGCTHTEPATQKIPFPGSWVCNGKVGTYNTTMLFSFYENRTGRFDLGVLDQDPPFFHSMEFVWESQGDRLVIGSSSEEQHLDIRYHPERDILVVNADKESGIFIGDEFVTGPFTWEFSRARRP